MAVLWPAHVQALILKACADTPNKVIASWIREWPCSVTNWSWRRGLSKPKGDKK